MASSAHVCAIDIGTTAVKCALIQTSTATVVASATVNTDAYTDADPPRKEQDVGMIISAVGSALLILTAKCKGIAIDGIALCSQMHDVLTFATSNPMQPGPLVTWEDQRGATEGRVAQCNRALWSSGHRRAPLFPGYGCYTLAHTLSHDEPAGGLPPAHDRATSIVAYVAAALTGGDAWTAPAMEATDAAAWGCFDPSLPGWDMAAAACLHPTLPSLLPPIKGTGVVVGYTGGEGCHPSFSSLPPSLLHVPVTVGLGDHQASVLGRLALEGHTHSTAQASGPATGDDIALVNIGTSAQVAFVGPIVSAVLTSGTALPPGCEVRPYPCLPGVPPPTGLLVCASMNGGSALAAVQERTRAIGASTGASLTPGECYAWLEREGGRYLQHGGQALPLLITSLPVPERVPQGWGEEDAQAAREQQGEASADVLALSLSEALARLSSPSPSTRLQPGLVYAAAARAVASLLLDRVPPAAMHRLAGGGGAKVLTSGGALAKSSCLRTAWSQELSRRLWAQGVGQEVASGPQEHTGARTQDNGGIGLEYAGCVGTAIVTAAWLAHKR